MRDIYGALKTKFAFMLSGVMLTLLLCTANAGAESSRKPTFRESAETIRQTYEPQLFTLPNARVAHYGLRMYRQTLNVRYRATISNDLARIVSRLNRFATEVHTPQQIERYTQKRLGSYQRSKNARKQTRYQATRATPEYLYIIALLGSMARADEYGLQHREDAKLRKALRRYDFAKSATDPAMIRAWAAQLANQVFWLRQLGEQDVVKPFVAAFRQAYPDSQDTSLSVLQYGNKLYGMTHIIFADSQFYQKRVSAAEYQWIFDYFRANIDEILRRAKPDIVAEVGIAFLLAGLNDDPVVLKTRRFIQAQIDPEKGMIPSVTGRFYLSSGGHRNVLAIMLLDWWSVNEAPTMSRHPAAFRRLPFGLIKKPL